MKALTIKRPVTASIHGNGFSGSQKTLFKHEHDDEQALPIALHMSPMALQQYNAMSLFCGTR